MGRKEQLKIQTVPYNTLAAYEGAEPRLPHNDLRALSYDPTEERLLSDPGQAQTPEHATPPAAPRPLPAPVLGLDAVEPAGSAPSGPPVPAQSDDDSSDEDSPDTLPHCLLCDKYDFRCTECRA